MKLTIVLFSLLAIRAVASEPQTIDYQGVLGMQPGSPMED